LGNELDVVAKKDIGLDDRLKDMDAELFGVVVEQHNGNGEDGYKETKNEDVLMVWFHVPPRLHKRIEADPDMQVHGEPVNDHRVVRIERAQTTR